MDTITHTLFGLALYGAIDKKDMQRPARSAFLFTAVGASQIPDIDVVSQLWDNEGMYQMWHRGITHSVLLTPVWALLFLSLSYLFFRVKDKKLFFLAWIAVLIHDTSDLFNAWGTGYFEPVSNIRLTFGTVPIIDFMVWLILGAAFLASRKNKLKGTVAYKIAWCLIAVHFLVQSVQGWVIYDQYKNEKNQVALSAGFIPWTYTVIEKKEDIVTIYQDNLFQEREKQYELVSSEDANLNELFNKRPEAKTLYQWSPFVVIVEDDKRLGLYDPRFYRDGQSFLFEYIEKTQ
ncbi:metal-dependent hydrolase [Bacillus sp. T33-2]|uniref:metal-dependent hydrolase n=1 Tax=Bacillus sp. T33-2 TaxID=2054168 RepID=UPI000C762BEA|nr:metal-dependent hydrolase [Bacillus sp. T33-2]PLR97520.1 metal-dependent hydrolase [Bacillus sp. T33-2]